MAKSASPSRRLAVTAKTSYLHFLWGMSFGVIAVLSTPLVAVTALIVAAFKNSHDTLMHMWQ